MPDQQWGMIINGDGSIWRIEISDVTLLVMKP